MIVLPNITEADISDFKDDWKSKLASAEAATEFKSIPSFLAWIAAFIKPSAPPLENLAKVSAEPAISFKTWSGATLFDFARATVCLAIFIAESADNPWVAVNIPIKLAASPVAIPVDFAKLPTSSAIPIACSKPIPNSFDNIETTSNASPASNPIPTNSFLAAPNSFLKSVAPTAPNLSPIASVAAEIATNKPVTIVSGFVIKLPIVAPIPPRTSSIADAAFLASSKALLAFFWVFKDSCCVSYCLSNEAVTSSDLSANNLVNLSFVLAITVPNLLDWFWLFKTLRIFFPTFDCCFALSKLSSEYLLLCLVASATCNKEIPKSSPTPFNEFKVSSDLSNSTLNFFTAFKSFTKSLAIYFLFLMKSLIFFLLVL